MAEAEPQEENHESAMKKMENCKKELEKLLEEMEKVTAIASFLAKTPALVVSVGFVVRAAWMTYNIVTMHTDPDLAHSMKHLDDAFLRCKEQMERKWQEVLKEPTGEEQTKQ